MQDLREMSKCDMPSSGVNLPPFSMTSLNEESGRLNEPSGSLFIKPTSDYDTECLGVDMMMNVWKSVEVLRKLGLCKVFRENSLLLVIPTPIPSL